MSDSFRPHGTVACQAPPSTGFSRQEYWSGVPCPSPGDLPDPGIGLGLLHCRQTHYHLSDQGRPCWISTCGKVFSEHGFPFPSLQWSSDEQKFQILSWFNLSIFPLHSAFCINLKKSLPTPRSQRNTVFLILKSYCFAFHILT